MSGFENTTPRENEERLRQVTETIGLAFWLRDVSPPLVLYASPGVEQIFGVSPEEFLRDPLAIQALIHPDDREAVMAQRDAMSGQGDLEFRIVRPDGQTRWIRTRSAPVLAEHGRVTRLAAVSDDVTDEHELRESERRLRLVVDSVPDYAIVTLDPEGHVVGWNTGAGRITGYSADEIIGRHFSVFYPPEQVEAGHPEHELEIALTAGRYQEEGQRLRKDGSHFWADVTLTPIHNGAGRLRGFAKVTRDVTEHKEIQEALRESEERFRMLAENSRDVIRSYEVDGTIRYASPSCHAVLGYDPEELVGRLASEFLHPDDVAGRDERRRTVVATAADSTITYRARRKDGDYVWIEANVRALHDPRSGELVGFQEAARDISERRQAEAAIRRAKEEAEQANNAKSEFLSRMSHELRTPLHAILGFGGLLRREDLRREQDEKVVQILRSGRHLLDLINEVLDLSLIERGELGMSPEPVDTGEVVREALAMVAPLAEARSVRLPAPRAEDPAIHVLADRQRLKQVLLNLLSNAVKYNRDGGEVRLHCRLGGSGRVCIEVADTGMGIAPDELTRVFDAFDRLGADTTDVEGTGLGLALSKRLVEAMDGEIGLRSRPGEGTTFWVELPEAAPPHAAQASAEEEPARPAERVRGPARTVLLVEDNPSNIKLVETILGDRPEVTLIVATRGELAVELAVEHRPALVLLDLNLPDVSGEVVLRRLRSDERTAETPIVVVSADATPRQVLRIRRAGADDYLTKPFGLERFLAVIDGSGPADGADATSASRAAEAPGVLDAATIRALHALASRPTVGPSAVRELLEVFLVDSRERLAALEAAARADDLAGVERQAHALAGASGGVGSAEFTTLCRRVEAAAKAGDAQSVRSTVSELGPALDAACAVLAAEFGLP